MSSTFNLFRYLVTKLRYEHPPFSRLPAASDSKLIVVLGMHRSGTSVITRGLKALGVEIVTAPGAGKFAIARVEVSKLLEVAKLAAVRYISPVV